MQIIEVWKVCAEALWILSKPLQTKQSYILKKGNTFNIPHLNMNITSLIQGKNMYITSLIQGKKTRGKMDHGTKKENY